MPKVRSHGEGEVAKWKNSKSPNTAFRARKRVTLPDGRKVRPEGYGPTAKKAIEDRERKIKQLTASHPAAGDLTVLQLAAKVLEFKSATLKDSSIDDYAKTLRIHILPQIGTRRFATLTVMDLQDVLNAVAQTGKLNAAEKTRKMLYMLFRQAMKWQLTDRNPADMLERVLRHPPKRGIWQPEEVEAFLTYVKEFWYYPVYYTTLSTGMRRGEVVALTWSDVRNGSIHVTRTYSQVGSTYQMGPPKTRESNRRIPMSESLKRMLDEHKTSLEAHAVRTKREWQENGLVFPSQTGQLLYPPNLRTRLKYYAEKAGVPAIRFHDLRRIYATTFIRSGGDPKQLQRRLGHATPNLAMAIYTDTIEADLNDAVFDLEDVRRLPHLPETDVDIDALLEGDEEDDG